uniref:AlNc14C312G10498 protein n=1 Tax=Albugo laibachii Nc14 TaxID=890382 RepID=F0WW53_9STRA|nr:AlNc14C312G10498 [Albugo laibachii Nc14]|eukprot:CCA25672.1 AlNc14C312G10498 [Albugo laibachii Nc14]
MIEAKAAQTVWVRSNGKTKERVTCMILDYSFGNKYQPVLIFKSTIPLKKETAAENNTKRHGFGKRVLSSLNRYSKPLRTTLTSMQTPTVFIVELHPPFFVVDLDPL